MSRMDYQFGLVSSMIGIELRHHVYACWLLKLLCHSSFGACVKPVGAADYGSSTVASSSSFHKNIGMKHNFVLGDDQMLQQLPVETLWRQDVQPVLWSTVRYTYESACMVCVILA